MKNHIQLHCGETIDLDELMQKIVEMVRLYYLKYLSYFLWKSLHVTLHKWAVTIL